MLSHLLAALAFGMAPADDVKAPASYLETIPVFWRELYPDGGKTLYCDQRFERFDRAVNVEHVFPMSWATQALHCGDRDQCRRRSERFNRIESDLHNLYPARKDINKARGSYPFGDIKGERPLVPGCDFEIDYRRRRAEPRPAVRGEIARSMLYMEQRHGLPLYRRTKALMERWHLEDPPSDEERRRNDRIERLQGNRNPFIDSSERRK